MTAPFLMFLLGMLAGCAPKLSPVEPLTVTAPFLLGGQERKMLPLALPAGSPLRITVAGRGIDVRVALDAAEGARIIEIDAPGRATGTEVLLIEPSGPQDFTLVIAGNDYATVQGRVSVEAERLPALSDDDRDRIAAARLEMTAAALTESAGPSAVAEAAAAWASAAAIYLDLDAPALAARAHMQAGWLLERRAWQYQQAVASAERAVAIARDAGLDEVEAHALMCAGAAQTSYAQSMTGTDSKRALAEFAAARQSHEKAARIYADRNLPGLEALALNYSGVAAHYAGDWDAAERLYHTASERWLAIGDTAHHTLALQSLALLFNERGDPREAIDYFDRALSQRAAMPRLDYAYTLYNSGLAYHLLGRFDEAIERYHSAMQVFAAVGERPAQARALQGIAAVLKASGEPQRARDVLREVIAMLPRGVDDRARAFALLLLGEIERDLGRLDESIALHTEALVLTHAPNDEIRVRVALAEDLRLAGQAMQARSQLDTALELELPRTHRARARAWREIGLLAADQGERQASDQAFAEALDLYEATGAELERASVLEARAGVAFAAREFERSAADAAAAMEVFARTSVLGLHADQRVFFRAARRDTLELQIDALMALAHAARQGDDPARAQALEHQAFEVSDRSRSLLLLDALGSERPDLSDDQRVRRHLLLEQLAGKRSRKDALLAQTAPDTAQIEQLSNDIVRIRTELDVLAARAYDASRSADAPNRAATALAVPAGTTVAEYFIGQRGGWLFVLGAGPLSVHALPERETVERLAREVHDAWGSAASDPKNLGAVIAELDELLFAPLAHVDADDALLLVPDGPLHLLPLASLATRADASFTARDIATIPSVLAASAAHGIATPAPRLLAMIGDPVFGTDDPRFRDQGSTGLAPSPDPDRVARSPLSLNSLERLPAAAIEARDILALVPEDQRLALLGFDANLENVRAAHLDDYRILHFATHAWSDSVDPSLATLALSTTDRQGQLRDGALRAADLAALRLNADLVVLSGCETALGRRISGEGLVGLSNAFLRAGAGTVVASLWRVPDTSTAYLMREFYRALFDGSHTPSRALRAAQRTVRSQPRWADPYFWAGFQVLTVAPSATTSYAREMSDDRSEL
jgi:CHAT domain-containing protein